MKYKKSEITKFARTCAYGANQMLNGVCTAEEVSTSDIGRTLMNEQDEEILLEVSKRFAKCAKDQMGFDVANGDVQNFQNIIDMIIDCCESNDWFEQE